MELAKGGEVFHRLLEKEVFEELEAADMMVQLLGAVQHMHQQGIVHRDLKVSYYLYSSSILYKRKKFTCFFAKKKMMQCPFFMVQYVLCKICIIYCAHCKSTL